MLFRSSYLLEKLVPALQQRCRVCLIDSYVEDLAALFNRAKVYLYDSAEYWALQGVSEGFGLQPLEALACGCQVFSSINGGLSDYLDPGFNCYKIAGYSTQYDVDRILQALQSPIPRTLVLENLAEYRRENIIKRLTAILTEINEFFDCYYSYSSDIPRLTQLRQLKLKAGWLWQKVRRIYSATN